MPHLKVMLYYLGSDSLLLDIVQGLVVEAERQLALAAGADQTACELPSLHHSLLQLHNRRVNWSETTVLAASRVTDSLVAVVWRNRLLHPAGALGATDGLDGRLIALLSDAVHGHNLCVWPIVLLLRLVRPKR